MGMMPQARPTLPNRPLTNARPASINRRDDLETESFRIASDDGHIVWVLLFRVDGRH